MRFSIRFVLSSCLLAVAASSSAEPPVLDCSKKSLAAAVEHVSAKDPVIVFTGVCEGPIVISQDGLTLEGVGLATIDGGGQDAVTVQGASRVSLTGIDIRNGRTGLLAVNGAHISLNTVNVHDNLAAGISLQTGSSAALTDVTTAQNGLHGLELQAGSSATVSGALNATGNRVFGINVNSSAIRFVQATVSASGNALGIQIGISANAFINDPQSVINASNNASTGMTIVSGAHLVSFGGTINASNNPVAGVTVNSNAGLDLDAASTINSTNNGDGVRIQQGSVMTVFNTPQFSGQPGFSTINARNNTGSGIRVLSASTLTLVNQARVNSNQNGGVGLAADNGAGVTLVNSTITGNTSRDLQLTFAARADLQTTQFGTVACDATVFIRGIVIMCPQ